MDRAVAAEDADQIGTVGPRGTGDVLGVTSVLCPHGPQVELIGEGVREDIGDAR